MKKKRNTLKKLRHLQKKRKNISCTRKRKGGELRSIQMVENVSFNEGDDIHTFPINITTHQEYLDLSVKNSPGLTYIPDFGMETVIKISNCPNLISLSYRNLSNIHFSDMTITSEMLKMHTRDSENSIIHIMFERCFFMENCMMDSIQKVNVIHFSECFNLPIINSRLSILSIKNCRNVPFLPYESYVNIASLTLLGNTFQSEETKQETIDFLISFRKKKRFMYCKTDLFIEECPICLNEIPPNNRISTRCHHVFHRNCLNRVKETNINPLCPMCRKRI